MNLEKNVDIKIWNKLLANSPQNNIFSNYEYLELIDKKFSNYVLVDKSNPIIGAIIYEEDLINIPTFYSPLLLDAKIQSPHDLVSKCSKFLEELDKYEKKVQIRSHYNFKDIRSFLWFNYHEENIAKKFKASPYYTAILDIEKKTYNEIFDNINQSRRQEIRKAEKVNCISSLSSDIEAFDYLNNQTYLRSRKRSDLETFIIKNVIEKSINNNFGTLMLTKDKNNEPVAGSFFLHDKSTSYYYAGGYKKNKENQGAATLNIIEHIEYCINQNQKKIDFVGANSPNRGYFKTSFGADIKIYFELFK